MIIIYAYDDLTHALICDYIVRFDHIFGDIDKVTVSIKIRFADTITSLFFILQAECYLASAIKFGLIFGGWWWDI